MRVALFTDTDFDSMDGGTTSLRALLGCAPADVRPRIYTLADLEIDEPDYLALRSPLVLFTATPDRDRRLYVARLSELLHLRRRGRTRARTEGTMS